MSEMGVNKEILDNIKRIENLEQRIEVLEMTEETNEKTEEPAKEKEGSRFSLGWLNKDGNGVKYANKSSGQTKMFQKACDELDDVLNTDILIPEFKDENLALDAYKLRMDERKDILEKKYKHSVFSSWQSFTLKLIGYAASIFAVVYTGSKYLLRLKGLI